MMSTQWTALCCLGLSACVISQATQVQNSGGATSGGPTNGGASNGGASNGGASNGGATNGGASSGSAANGGATSGAGSSSGNQSTAGGGGIPPSAPSLSLLPSHVLVGLKENDGTWMAASGVSWDVRWAYFTSSVGVGWYNGFVGGTASKDWAQGWLESAVSQHFIPAVVLYNIQSDYYPSTDHGVALDNVTPILVGGSQARLQQPATMKDYFSKVKLFMQAAKAVSSPVILIVEGDAFGFIESQSHNDPTTYAAIADSGLDELKGLPNTVAGFGLAFLALRKSVGATNVVMGPDLPSYESIGGDFLNYSVTADLQTQVDYQFASFFSHFGVGASDNAVGERFDFTASCPASLDSGEYAASGDTARTWDPSDSAPTNKASLNRYAAWLSLYYQATQTPWLLWQIPMGNSNSPNVYSVGGKWAGPYTGITVPASCNASSQSGCPSGYTDNRAEYFFGSESSAHLKKFVGVGVFGLLFGAGGGGATDELSDYYTDGKSFFQKHVGDIVNAGGFPITR